MDGFKFEKVFFRNDVYHTNRVVDSYWCGMAVGTEVETLPNGCDQRETNCLVATNSLEENLTNLVDLGFA